MKITFDGHQKSQREVELTQQDLAQLFEIMKEEFETHITYASFDHYRQTPLEKRIGEFCDKFGVDVQYKKDRCSFFQALLNDMVNPYEQND